METPDTSKAKFKFKSGRIIMHAIDCGSGASYVIFQYNILKKLSFYLEF